MDYSKAKEASDYIYNKTKCAPEICVILGSGLGDYAENINDTVKIEYADIPFFPQTSVQGHKGNLYVGKKVAYMQGRFHYYEGHTVDTVVFPIRVMKLLGVKKAVITNACGGINKSFCVGDLMLITDHISMFSINPLIGKNEPGFGERFPDMSQAYNKELISIAKEVSIKNNIGVREGVYAGLTGPSYETPAEINMLRILGADAVGMSTVSEVIAANHMNMKVLGISLITNMASGITNNKLSHIEVMEASNNAKGVFSNLLTGILERMQ